MAYNESDSWIKAINSNKYKSGNVWSSAQVQPISIGTIGSKLTMPKVQIKDYFKPNIPLKTLDKKRAKSLSDVVLGGPMGTLELRNTFDKYDVPDTLRAVPVMNKLIGAALLVNDNTIDPIAKGKYNEAIVNNLSAVANDFDILANPVKSLLPVAGGGHEGDFLSSLGLGDGYRKTFQWDSGSFVLDMIGETLSDPLTYITFGLGKGASTTANDVVNLTKENLAKTYGEQFVKTKLTDKEILNLIKEQGLQASKQTTVQNIITKTNDYLKELKTQLRTVKRGTKEYQELKELINKVYNATVSDTTNLINLNRAVAQVKNTKIFAQYETISKALNTVQKVQKVWGTAVYAAAPMVGAPMALLKEGSRVINHLRNKRITKLKDYDFEANLAAFSKAIEQMDKTDTTTWLASNVNKDWFKNLNNLLVGSGITVEDLIPLYKKIYSSIEPGKRTSNMLRTKFIDQVSNLILSKDKDNLVKEATEIFGKDIVSVQLTEADAILILDDAFDNIAEFTNMLIETDSIAQEMIEYANNKAVRQQLKHIEYGSALQDLVDLINKYRFEPVSDEYNRALDIYNNSVYGVDSLAVIKQRREEVLKYTKYMKMSERAGQSTKLNQLIEIIETLKSQGRMEEAKALNDLALELGITKDNLREVSDLYDIYRRSNGTNKHILNEIKDNCITNLTGLSNESGYKTAVDKYNKTAIDTYNSLLKRLSDPANAEAREEITTAFKQAAIHNRLINAEQIAEDFNKTKKVQDLAVEIKKKLNETDLLNQYDLGYIETQLNQIFNYAGEEEELGIIPRLESVFMSDYNLDNPDELRLFYNNLSELQTLVKKWKSTLNTFIPKSTNINVEVVRSFLQDIDDIINEQVGRITKENLDAISQVLTATTTYYTLTMSAQNRLDMVMSRLSQLTGVTAENYNEISRPNSAFRKRLDTLLKVVNTKDDMGMSVTKSIKNMLAIIDGTNNLEITRANAIRMIESILDAHYVKVDNEVKNYLVNIIFDTLYGTKNTYISKTSAFALTQKAWNRLSNLLNHIEQDFVESRLAMGEAEDVVNDLFLSFTDELHTAYENLFISYYNKQRTLDLFDTEPTVIYSFVSNSDKFIRSANDLSAQYDDLIQYLLDNKVDPDNIIVAKDFITTMSGNQTKLVLDNLKQKVYDTVNAAGLTDNWEIEQTQNIVDTIKQAFREIAKVNADYQQLDLLGKVTANANNKQKIYSIVNYISKEQLEEILSEYTIWNNIYDWTLANGSIAVKKVNDPDFLQRHFLTKESIDISSADAARFIETMRRQERRSEIALKYIDKKVIRQRRIALIQMYSDELLPWRPKQVETYFKTASDLDILMWHYTTLQRRLSNTMSQTYHSILDNLSNGTKLISKKVKKQLTDEAVLSEILDDVTNNPITDDDLFDALFETDYVNEVDLIGDITKENLQKRYKNTESLGVFKVTGEQYLKQDVNAYERLDALNNVLRPLGVNTNRELKVERTDSLATVLRSASPMQLKQYMRRNTNGILFYVSDNPKAVFNFTKEELESVGLAVTQPSNNKNITILVNLDDRDIGENLKYRLITKHNAVQSNVSEILNKNIYYYNFDDMDLSIDLFTGDMIDQTVYNTFLDDPRIRKAIQKVYPNFFEMTSNNFFEKSAIRPNTIIVGDPNAYNILYDYSSKTFHKVNKSSGYKYTNLYDSIIRGSTTAIKRVNGEHKWLDLFFNKDFSLKDTFAQAFEGASDEEIADVFKRNNWDAAVLKQNKKGEPVVYKIHIYNRKDLDLAMQQDAVILPHNVYRNAVLTINQHKLDTKLYKFYNSTIVATYKTMYLSTIGFLMRNAIDSGIFKNAQTTGGIGEILDNFKYEYRALKILEVYDDIIKEAQEYAIKRLNRPDKFNRGLVAEVLSHKPQEIQDIFKLTDAYINSAASAGLTKSMEEYLINYNLAHKGYQGFAISKWWDDNFLSMKPIQAIRDCNNTIEQTARYGLLLKLLEQGDTFAQAISKVIDTHFDYEIAGGGLKLLEQIFWFSTFPINNIMYWLNQGLENNSIAKLQFDMMEQSYNNKYISYDDVKESDYLLYNMMTGNIIFKPILGTDNQIILKIGSSLFDFFSLLMDPYNELKDRLNPFLSVLLGTEDLSQLNPAVTQFNSAKKIVKGQSYLPSVYAKLYPKHSYPKRTYTWNYNNKRYVRPTKTYSPRLPSMKQMNYKYLTYRYYYNKGPNRHINVSNTTSVEPYWYLRSFYRTNYNKLKLKGYLRRKGISTVGLHL